MVSLCRLVMRLFDPPRKRHPRAPFWITVNAQGDEVEGCSWCYRELNDGCDCDDDLNPRASR